MRDQLVIIAHAFNYLCSDRVFQQSCMASKDIHTTTYNFKYWFDDIYCFTFCI